jgi:thioredoxin-dependent peroxiredoxin
VSSSVAFDNHCTTRYLRTINQSAIMKLHAITIALVTGLLATMSALAAEAPALPKVGDKAPLVEGKDQDGKNWNLADDIGKKVVLLYFYPKDQTPGCTKEACGFRDSIDELKQDNVEVIGVSFDSGESHLKFITKYNLNFPLIADTDGKIADTYGVRMTGRSMARRVSFLIGLDGKIVHVTDSPNAETHLSEMKAAAAKLKT